MNFETILYKKDGNLVTIILNRPDVLNALNDLIKKEVKQAIGNAAIDEEVRCIVVTGTGRSFSTGNDMKGGGGAKTLEQQRKKYHDEISFGLAFWDCPKPIIAAVNGYCLALGFDMALACDIIIAAENATFGLPEVRHGAGANILFEPWILGMRRTKELLFTGNTITAQEAEKMGIVNRVVPYDKLMDETYKLSRKIATVPAPAVQIAKQGVNRTYEIMGLKQSLTQNAELMVLLALMESPERTWWRQIVKEKGLKEALKLRAAKFED